MLYFYYWLCSIPNPCFYCHVYLAESNSNYFDTDNAEHVRDIYNILLLKTINKIGTPYSHFMLINYKLYPPYLHFMLINYKLYPPY